MDGCPKMKISALGLCESVRLTQGGFRACKRNIIQSQIAQIHLPIHNITDRLKKICAGKYADRLDVKHLLHHLPGVIFPLLSERHIP